MKIDFKFTFPIEKQRQYVEGCVPWSSFDPKQTKMAYSFLSKYFDFCKI